MAHLDKIFRKTDNTVTKEVGDECIIVPMADNVADMESVFTLNDTGAFFWALIDGERTVNQIVEVVLEEYDVDRETVIRDFSAFLAEMSDWIEEV